MSLTQPMFNVRAAAEMLGKPLEKRISSLRRQKHPKEGANKFAVPYYGPVVAGIRNFFRDGEPALCNARAKIQGLSLPSRRQHCERVLHSFETDDFSGRPLSVIPNSRITTEVAGVILKLSPDMQAVENGQRVLIYFNCGNSEYPPETARRLLEIAHYAATLGGFQVDPKQFIFVDLFNQKKYQITKVRQSTIDLMIEDFKQVDTLWPDL